MQYHLLVTVLAEYGSNLCLPVIYVFNICFDLAQTQQLFQTNPVSNACAAHTRPTLSCVHLVMSN